MSYKRSTFLALIIVCAIILIEGCQRGRSPTRAPTSSPVYITQIPDPSRQPPGAYGPIISGSLSGLPDNIYARVSVTLPSGGPISISFSKNGFWQAHVSSYGETYIVKAEVEGYISDPVNYTIKLIDGKPYVPHFAP
jgi:hypothetical protein